MTTAFKIVLLLLVDYVYGEREKGSCDATAAMRYELDAACEGGNITLECPKEKPRLNLETALYGRWFRERVICRRPNRTGYNYDPWNETKPCKLDVLKKVSDWCQNRKTCHFNVNSTIFSDPCPQIYKFFIATYKCMCARRYTRSETSSTKCFPRKLTKSQVATSSAASPSVIGSPLLPHVASTTDLPITSSSLLLAPVSTPCTQSVAITPTMAISGNQKKLDTRRKTFFILLELCIIYNGILEDSSSMAVIWFFIGVLFGLFSVIIACLLHSLHRKPKEKLLFRLSQLESNKENAQSPTIETSSQFPDSQRENNNSRDEAEERKKPRINNNPSREDNNVGSIDSAVNLCNTNTIKFTNPLWIGHQKKNTSDTGTSNCSHPTRSKQPSGETKDSTESAEPRHFSGSHETSINVPGISPETRRSSNTLPDHEIQNTKPLPNGTKNGNTDFPSSNRDTVIPVGIPSHPIPIESHLLNASLVSSGMMENGRSKSVRDNAQSQTKSKDFKPPDKPTKNLQHPPKLLSRFGVNSDTPSNSPVKKREPGSRQTSCYSAGSSPCLYSENFDQETTLCPKHKRAIENESTDGTTSTGNKGILTRPVRSLSLDSHYYSNIPLVTRPHKETRNTTDDNQSQKTSPTTADTTIKLGNVPNGLSHSPKARDSDWSAVVPRSNAPWSSRRASSGYYSNSTSPSFENPLGVVKSGDSLGRTKEGDEKKLELEKNMHLNGSVNGTDDLPPLPPPPPPFIPISPLPHLFGAALQPAGTQKNYKDNKEPRSPSRTGVRRVHFELATELVKEK